MTKLTLIRGLPGSGKSTRAREIAQQTGAVHLEADQWFMVNGEYKFDPSKLHHAHRWCQEQAKQNLKMGNDVVVSNTFTRRREAKPYIDMANQLGAKLEIITATGDYGSIHDVPDEAIERMRARWEKF